MDAKRDGFFWLILLLVSVLTALYVDRHKLPERFLDYRRGLVQVQDAEMQSKMLEFRLDTARQRVENLGSDSLEIEESVRHNKDYVREGETVYRIIRKPADPPLMPDLQ